MAKISIAEPWFTHVATGKKLYEAKCYWHKAISYKLGDYVIIECKQKMPLIRQITSIRCFDTFEEAVLTLGVDKILPGLTVGQAVEYFARNMRLTTQLEYGVVVLGFCQEFDQA